MLLRSVGEGGKRGECLGQWGGQGVFRSGGRDRGGR